jgi:hypothetical protein
LGRLLGATLPSAMGAQRVSTPQVRGLLVLAG